MRSDNRNVVDNDNDDEDKNDDDYSSGSSSSGGGECIMYINRKIAKSGKNNERKET